MLKNNTKSSNNIYKILLISFLFFNIFSNSNSQTSSRLHLLHLADAEAATNAIQTAPNFAALVDKFVEQGDNLGLNTLILASGDNYLPGAFFSSGGDLLMRNAYRSATGNNTHREANGYADILIHNILGVMASAIGNHEFDLGTATFRELMLHNIPNPTTDIRYLGTAFPYLSANLDFSGDANLNSLFTNTIQSNTNFITTNPLSPAPRKIAPATIITINGERYGVIGATTPIVENISSTGGVRVKEPGRRTNDMAALASILQPYINELRTVHNINKIILLAHMQQIQFERELIRLLSGVDIVIAGGSNSILADNNDRLIGGDSRVDSYPILTTNRDGEPALIVNTDGGYKYVGRLLVDFDANGVIIPNSIDNNISGAWAADVQNVTNLFGGNYNSAFSVPTSRAARVKTITDGISNIVSSKDGNLFGWTDVFLEGRRTAVRTKETNLGNLSADANLWYARQTDPTVQVSIKNGGGIRAEIGVVTASGTSTYAELPPIANPLANKLAGQISQLDIENSMRFNNDLTIFTLTAAQLIQTLNHGIAATVPGATPGQFAQIGGVKFTYNPSLPVGSKIVSAFLTNANGQNIDTLILNSIPFGNQSRTIRCVTLGFLTTGGDSYPINSFETSNPTQFNRLNLRQIGTFTGLARFAENGTEQDAFAEYTATLHNTKANAFKKGVEGRITRTNSFDIISQPNEVVNCQGSNNNSFEFIVNLDLNFYDFYVQWSKDGKNFGTPQINSSKLILPTLTYDMSGVYNARIWTVIKNNDPSFEIEKTDITNQFLLNVLGKMEFTTQPKSQIINLGDEVSIDFEAHISGIIGGLNDKKVIIQWYKGNNLITDNNRIAGSKSSNLTIRNVNSTDYANDYKVVITGQCGTITSNNFFIIAPPSITINSQPVSQELCIDNEMNFSVTATITDASNLTYQWYLDGNVLVDGLNIIGSKTSNLKIKVTKNSQVWCMVSSTLHNISVLTDKVDAKIKLQPTITNQLTDLSVETDKELLLFVRNTGNNITYKWLKDNIEIPNSNNDTLIISKVKTTDAGKYKCEVSNECGSVISNESNVTVTSSIVWSSVDELLENNDIIIYPNPINQFAKILFKANFNGKNNLEILDLTGRIVFTKEISFVNGENAIELNLENLNLSNGSYYLNIYLGNNQTLSKKLNIIK